MSGGFEQKSTGGFEPQASSSASGHAAAPHESNKKARIVSFAPDTDLPDHDCGELFAFFKERAKERCEMN